MADKVKRNYDESNIQHYEGLVAVREKPTMYIGAIGQQGTFHLFKETIGNCIDEFTAGRATMATVTIDSKQKTVMVQDDAMGMPIGKFEEIISQMHTSGKYDKSGSGAYQFSLGTFGLGIKLVNALSETFIVDTYNSGKHGHAEYHAGVKKELTIKNDTSKNHGTTILYRPDVTVLLDIQMNKQYYTESIEILTYINPGFRIDLNFDGEKHSFCHPEGMGGYLRDRLIKPKKIRSIANIISFNDKTSIIDKQVYQVPDPEKPGSFKEMVTERPIDMTYEVHFTWSESTTNELLESYANSLRTVENGTHVTGFRSALTKAIVKYIEENSLIPKAAKYTVDGNDVREALCAVVVAQHSDILYNTQTKTSVSNTNIQYWMTSSIYNKFSAWLNANKKEAVAICNVVMKCAKARAAAKAARENIIKAAKMDFVSIDPDKFSGCSTKNPEEAELYIVEGDSAKGSARPARNSKYQAVFAVRGKTQNILKSAKDKLAAEMAMLVEILGCGIGPTFNINKLRYHKIVFGNDADSDGDNIAALLSAFFFTYYPELIEAGYVYRAVPPLFKLKFPGSKDNVVFLKDMTDLNKTLTYIASEAFDFQTNSGKKLSKELCKVYVNKIGSFKDFMYQYARQTNTSEEFLEQLVIHYKEIKSGNYEGLERNGFYCQVIPGGTHGIHLSIDKDYEHYFVVLDDLFHDSVYLPIAKRLADIRLMDVCFKGKNTGKLYGGSTVRNAVFVESLLLGNRVDVQRIKGLGESDSDILRYYLLNPNTRTIIRLTMDDAEKASKVFDICLGRDIEGRKEFCMTGNLV